MREKINLNTLNTRGLKGLRGDVRRQNHFVLYIQDIFDGVDNGLELVVRQAFLPKVSLSVLNLRRGNDAIKLPGVADWTGGTITVLDTLSKVELQALLGWFNQTYNTETGAMGLASEFKKGGFVTEYASDGRYIRQWPLTGMWISDPDFGTLDATADAEKELSFTIQIDPGRLDPIHSDDVNPAYND